MLITSRSVSFLVMEIFGQLLRAKIKNIFIIVTTEQFLMMTRAISTSKSKATHVANLFLDHRIASYTIPDHLLTDNGPQFVSMVFATLCRILALNDLTTTAYHLQTSARVERYDRKIATRIRH